MVWLLTRRNAANDLVALGVNEGEIGITGVEDDNRISPCRTRCTGLCLGFFCACATPAPPNTPAADAIAAPANENRRKRRRSGFEKIIALHYVFILGGSPKSVGVASLRPEPGF